MRRIILAICLVLWSTSFLLKPPIIKGNDQGRSRFHNRGILRPLGATPVPPYA